MMGPATRPTAPVATPGFMFAAAQRGEMSLSAKSARTSALHAGACSRAELAQHTYNHLYQVAQYQCISTKHLPGAHLSAWTWSLMPVLPSHLLVFSARK